MLAILAQVSDFVSGSPHRVAILDKKVEDYFKGEFMVKALCRTRWIECHDSVMNVFIIIVTILEEIIEVGNADAVGRANGHLAYITQFPFIVALKMAVLLFGIARPLSEKLQSPVITLTNSMEMVKRSRHNNRICQIRQEK